MRRLAGLVYSTDMSLNKLLERVKDREAWLAADYEAAESYTTWPLNNKDQ